MQPLKERLVLRRNKLALTQESLALRSNVSARAIADYESGKQQPSVRILNKLSAALGVSSAWLLGGTEELHETEDNNIEHWKLRALRAEESLDRISEDLFEVLHRLNSSRAHKRARSQTINSSHERIAHSVSKKIPMGLQGKVLDEVAAEDSATSDLTDQGNA